MAGGPAEDLDDYAAGADACEAFLVLMQTGAETLGDFHAVDAIQSFLASDVDWDARATRGWTASRREAMESRCDEILGRDGWDDRIAVALLSDDPAEFWRAERAARRRGIDTFEIHVDKSDEIQSMDGPGSMRGSRLTPHEPSSSPSSPARPFPWIRSPPGQLTHSGSRTWASIGRSKPRGTTPASGQTWCSSGWRVPSCETEHVAERARGVASISLATRGGGHRHRTRRQRPGPQDTGARRRHPRPRVTRQGRAPPLVPLMGALGVKAARGGG